MPLHGEGQLVTGDAGRQIAVVGALGEVGGVVVVERVEQAALGVLAHAFGPVEVEDRVAGRAQHRALEAGRHVAARPVLGAADRPAGRIEHDHEAGQVLVDAAEAVVHPRAETRVAGEDFARVHLQHGRAVNGRIGRHRVKKGDVVHAGRQVGEEVADPLAALAVLLELPLRPDDAALVLLAAAAEGLDGDGLAVEVVELRLVVEGVDVRRAAVHEEEDDALGLGRQRRRLRRERVGELVVRLGGRGLVEEAGLREQAGQGDAGEAGAGFPEELAAGATAEGAGMGRLRSRIVHNESPRFMPSHPHPQLEAGSKTLLVNCGPLHERWPTAFPSR